MHEVLPDPLVERSVRLLMSKYMIPAGVVGFRGTAEAFAIAEFKLGPLPPGPYLCDGETHIRLFTYSGPQPIEAPEGLEFLGSFTVIETE